MSEPRRLDPKESPCEVHARHTPRPLVIVEHHIRPQGMGGPDEPGNIVRVCDTGHRSIHTLMGELVTADRRGIPAPASARGTRKERELARRGFDEWVAAGRPGTGHAAYALHHPQS